MDPQQSSTPSTNPLYTDAPPTDPVALFASLFARQKASAQHAIAQLTDEQFFRRPADSMNSVAIIVEHVSGNLRSRWTDFLTTDGEKLDRDRDAEFSEPVRDRAAMMGRWDEAWAITLASIHALSADDLVARTVMIRRVQHTVLAALCRSLEHTGCHVGQIHVIARLMRGSEGWEWISIRPGGSRAFNEGLLGNDRK